MCEMSKINAVMTKVFFYIPNIIGYVRVATLLVSCFLMPSKPELAMFVYVFSNLLDAVDGFAARHFGQSSQFGALLDMLTDRCAGMCLQACLCTLYPSYLFIFQLSLLVDIASHWGQMYNSLLCNNAGHKNLPPDANPLLRFYYSNKSFLFSMCCGNELFFVALYLTGFNNVTGSSLWFWLAIGCAPVALLKFIISIIQLIHASTQVALVDENRVKQN